MTEVPPWLARQREVMQGIAECVSLLDDCWAAMQRAGSVSQERQLVEAMFLASRTLESCCQRYLEASGS